MRLANDLLQHVQQYQKNKRNIKIIDMTKKKTMRGLKTHAVNSNRFFDKLLSDLINQFNFKQRDSKRGVNADSFML